MQTYEPLASEGEDGAHDLPLAETSTCTSHESRTMNLVHCILLVVGCTLAMTASFAAGAFSARSGAQPNVLCSEEFANMAHVIPLPPIQRAFTYPSPFAMEPPQGPGSGQISEPVWDTLIPSGLGYFKDETLTPHISIPTVFHQLHCLYTLRRAYYSGGDELEEFDLGKDRATHVAHCFDYLQQGLTCSADTTIEPAIDEKHSFLGSDLQRRCRNFDVLKHFVEERRVFNASGFLAHGLSHEHIGT